MASTFLTADWRNLVMANYIVDPAVLQTYLPNKTELDFFEGKCYVSLVGFMFMNTRVLGFKIPFHINFEEVNLRFYVKYHDGFNWKRGTVFIKEIVPKPTISFIANTVYREKYETKKMRHEITETEYDIRLNYQWKHKYKWNRMEVSAEKPAQEMICGSKEEFIAEHYWGYSKFNNETTFEYNVQHPAWSIYPVSNYLIDCDFKALYGDTFSNLTIAKPDSVFVAQGSEVSVLKKRNL